MRIFALQLTIIHGSAVKLSGRHDQAQELEQSEAGSLSHLPTWGVGRGDVDHNEVSKGAELGDAYAVVRCSILTDLVLAQIDCHEPLRPYTFIRKQHSKKGGGEGGHDA